LTKEVIGAEKSVGELTKLIDDGLQNAKDNKNEQTKLIDRGFAEMLKKLEEKKETLKLKFSE
jgi:alpha-D-ribose 1-methylphosphonate 5-triphosphate synthase subunit PhnG